MNSDKKKCLASLASVVVLAGCVAAQPKPETAQVAAAPKTPAIKTFTNFTPALRCMDDLLLAYGKRDIVITTIGIPDSTGKVMAGTKEMLINAVSRMSVKSNALTFVELEGLSPELTQLFAEAAGAGDRKIPSYYIRGAISQLDDNALDSQQGAGIALPFLDLGVSRDQVSSLISVDMSIGESITRRIIPETSISNTMIITRAGQAGEAGGRIGKAGFSINVSLTKSEGTGSGVRSLIELGTIEAVGKLTQVPYWKCLQIEKTNPSMMEQARDWYDGMAQDKKVAFVQSKLQGMGVYRGAIDGRESAPLRDAVAQYQALAQLIPTGRIDFDLYYSLQNDEQPMAQDINPVPVAMAAPVAPTRSTVNLRLDSDKGPQPVYQIREYLRARVSMSQTGMLYCYYKDAGGTVARIFPNRFAPDPYVKANQNVSLPPENSPFKIRFDQPNAREQIVCFGSDRDMSLPPILQGGDLVPLRIGMDDVRAAFARANPAVGEAIMDIQVR